jgi:hypothetical protein
MYNSSDDRFGLARLCVPNATVQVQSGFHTSLKPFEMTTNCFASVQVYDQCLASYSSKVKCQLWIEMDNIFTLAKLMVPLENFAL